MNISYCSGPKLAAPPYESTHKGRRRHRPTARTGQLPCSILLDQLLRHTHLPSNVWPVSNGFRPVDSSKTRPKGRCFRYVPRSALTANPPPPCFGWIWFRREFTAYEKKCSDAGKHVRPRHNATVDGAPYTVRDASLVARAFTGAPTIKLSLSVIRPALPTSPYERNVWCGNN